MKTDRIRTGKNTYAIVCTESYEHEGNFIQKGEIRDHCFGRPIPEGWREATAEDWKKLIEKS